MFKALGSVANKTDESFGSKTFDETSNQNAGVSNVALAEKRLQILESEESAFRKNLKEDAQLTGTCLDMCPEIERYFREAKQRFSFFECHLESYEKSNLIIFDHNRAVKDYSRSSADQALPLPSDLRPTETLLKTLRYLLAAIVDIPEKKTHKNIWKQWYEFLWTRTRAIRKDIVQQRLCNETTALVLETIVRFHIYSAAHLVDQPADVFDARINSENLSKCLQSLKEIYSDLSLSSNKYLESESEFRSYMILMKLNDDNVVDEIQKLRPEIREASLVKHAIEAYHAIAENNYVKFFKLVSSASFFAACLMHRYFNQVRHKAIEVMVSSSLVPGSKTAQYTVDKMIKILGFENEEHIKNFFSIYNIEVDNEFVFLTKFDLNSSITHPEIRPSNLIKSKRHGKNLSELFFNGEIDNSWAITTTPSSSFPSSSLANDVPLKIPNKPLKSSLFSFVQANNVQVSSDKTIDRACSDTDQKPTYPDHEIQYNVDRLVDEICQDFSIKRLALELILNEYVWILTKEIMFEECLSIFNASKKKVEIFEEEKAYSLEFILNGIIREFTEDTLKTILPPIICHESIIMEEIMPEFLHGEIYEASREAILELTADLFYYRNLIHRSLKHWLKQTRYSQVSRKRSMEHLEILPLPLSTVNPSVEPFQAKRNRIYIPDENNIADNSSNIILTIVSQPNISETFLDWFGLELRAYCLNKFLPIDNDLLCIAHVFKNIDSTLNVDDDKFNIIILLTNSLNESEKDYFASTCPRNVHGIIRIAHTFNLDEINRVNHISSTYANILMSGKPSLLWSKNLGSTIEQMTKNQTLAKIFSEFREKPLSKKYENTVHLSKILPGYVEKKFLKPFSGYIDYMEIQPTTYHNPVSYLAKYNKLIEELPISELSKNFLFIKTQPLEKLLENDNGDVLLQSFTLFCQENSALSAVKGRIFENSKIYLLNLIKAVELQFLIPARACLLPWSKLVFNLISEFMNLLNQNLLSEVIEKGNLNFARKMKLKFTSSWKISSYQEKINEFSRMLNREFTLVNNTNRKYEIIQDNIENKLSSQINKVKSIFDKLEKNLNL